MSFKRESYESLVVPDKGFIKDYYDYASPVTEAPEIYHVFVSMALVAAVCSRGVSLNIGASKLFPNLWILLVGPSSRLRKTTAIRVGSNLLLQCDEDAIFPNEFTSEALLELLQEKPEGLFCWSEFGGVLEQFNRSYMAGTKEMLTDLFDCPPLHKRKLKSGEVKITSPCISILSASTIEWLQSKIKENDVMSGFLARFLYVVADSPSKILPFPPPSDEGRAQELVQKLKSMAAIKGNMPLSQAALDMYEDWYREQRAPVEAEPGNDRIAPFMSRLESYVLKFAMIYQLAEDGRLEVHEQNMQLALHLTRLLQLNVRCLFDDGLVFGREAQDAQKVLRITKRAKVITRSDLVKAFRDGAKRLDDALKTLTESEEIESFKDGSRTLYKLRSSHV